MGKSPLSSGGSRAARALVFVLFVFLAFTAALHSYVEDILSLKTYIYLPKVMQSDNNTKTAHNNSTTRLLEHDIIKAAHNITVNTLEQNSTITVQNSTTLVQNSTITVQNSTTLVQNNTITARNSTIIVQNSTITARNSTITARNSTITARNSTITARNSTIPVQNVTITAQNSTITARNSTIPVQNVTITAQNSTDSNTSRPTAVKNLKDVENNKSQLPSCTIVDNLGPVSVNKSAVLALGEIDQKYPEISRGGIFNLTVNCSTPDTVAIIVPYRDRHQHLAHFLDHMHPFLMKQSIAYGIYIVEQKGTGEFNRGKLFNVGSVEAQKLSNNYWKCFVFHDVDLLPLDTRNLYMCPKQPRHMSVAVDTMGFRLPSQYLFGGVSALTVEQFQYVNGFSNRYWGWGGEDDDMFKRLTHKGYEIARYKSSIAQYAMLNHERSTPNPQRFKLLSKSIAMLDNDGLSNLDYKVVHVQKFHLFTHILANIEINADNYPLENTTLINKGEDYTHQ